MKALTIWQPWASLIIAGAKPYEFRGWRAPASILGQRVVIHAGKHAAARDEVDDMLGLFELFPEESRELCLHADQAVPILEAFLRGELPIGAGLGTAIVGEPRLGTEIAEEFGVPRANDSDRDQHANWGWPMLEVEIWSEPEPCRGMQGLWTWPSADRFAVTL
jgi:hypothetical protein